MSEEKNIEEGTGSKEQGTSDKKHFPEDPGLNPGHAPQPQTPKTEPQTDMEVHHHSHAHGKKNWKSYFWEFLMLFLAVFCGFLAEYQLEHKIEKDKAKQYIISFYEDLKTDTSEFSRLLRIDNEKALIFSSVYKCYDIINAGLTTNSCLDSLVKNSLSFIDLIYTDRTLQQLKNAGGMRMLKKEDADSIHQYDYLLRRYLSWESSLFQERQSNLRHSYNEILSFKDLRAMRFPTDSLTDDPGKLILYSTDKGLLNKLFNELYGYSLSINTRLLFIGNLKRSAERLLLYFKNKYHLEHLE